MPPLAETAGGANAMDVRQVADLAVDSSNDDSGSSKVRVEASRSVPFPRERTGTVRLPAPPPAWRRGAKAFWNPRAPSSPRPAGVPRRLTASSTFLSRLFHRISPRSRLCAAESTVRWVAGEPWRTPAAGLRGWRWRGVRPIPWRSTASSTATADEPPQTS